MNTTFDFVYVTAVDRKLTAVHVSVVTLITFKSINRDLIKKNFKAVSSLRIVRRTS